MHAMFGDVVDEVARVEPFPDETSVHVGQYGDDRLDVTIDDHPLERFEIDSALHLYSLTSM